MQIHDCHVDKHIKAIGGVRGQKIMFGYFQRYQWAWINDFTECQNLILFRSYYNFNFGNLVGSLINLRTKLKF